MVNNSSETFTPTASGAIATFIFAWAVKQAEHHIRPDVISRDAAQPPYACDGLHLITPPRTPGGRSGDLLTRVVRRTGGPSQLRLNAWADRIAAALRANHLDRGTVCLHNDVELVPALKRRLPHLRIAHIFHNQLPARASNVNAFRDTVDAVAAVSGFTASFVSAAYGFAPDAVKVIYPGADLDAFRPPPARAGLPVIGFLGRTGIEKAPDVVLQACVQLASRTRNFEVQIVGSNHWARYEEDAYQIELNRLTAQLLAKGIAVTRPGHVTRAATPTWLQRSHIHVVPSRWDEPFGLTTVEGLATGNAVVGSATGGTPELIGNAGCLFERDDISGLTDELETLVLDPRLRAALGERARMRSEQFSWDRTWLGIQEWLSTE